MPTYEYKCDACGKQFDQFQSITAPVLKKCPHCHKSKLRRLISAGAGLIFKGSGFYITDYRSDSYKSAAKTDGAGGNGSTKTTTGSSASTPASTSSTSATPASTNSASTSSSKSKAGAAK